MSEYKLLKAQQRLLDFAFSVTSSKIIAPKECTTRYLLDLWLKGVQVK